MHKLFSIHVLVCFLSGIILIEGCKKDPVIPTLTTNAVTNITINSVTTGGSVTKDGGKEVITYGVCWSTTSSPMVSGSHTTDGKGTGSFSSTVTDLAPNTLYYIRAYATNSVGTAYGNELSFTTTPIVVPTITTTAISSVTQNSAISGGNITLNGGGDITARGVCWSTTSNPTTANSKTTDGTSMGEFASNLTDLLPGTIYYVRAYAINSAGTSYGNEVTFTTILNAPTNVSATPGSDQATITFTAPAGVLPITGYTVTSSPGNFTGTGSVSPIIVTGLTNGTAYTFTVIATSANGNSSPSLPSNSVTPSAVPGAPAIGTATAGSAQATVSFTAPASNGGSAITGYTVTSNPGNITGTGSSSPIIVTGLTGGTAYTFTVIATNANGNSLPSSASNSVTPSGVPGAPTIGTATNGDTQATVTFTPPVSNGGSAITGYTATSNPGNKTGTGAVSPIIVTGLTNGTVYTFTVVATNVYGSSLPSSASNSVTPLGVPGAPTIGTATEGNTQATVTFTAPVSNGGSPITGYTVTSNPGNISGTGAVSPIIVTGLTNGTAYTFTVIATNANGNSLPSSASNLVTPHTPETISDIDGNIYNIVSIGSQVWMAENLKVTKYLNGELIGTTTLDISGESAPKYQWAYGNDENNVPTYGRIYTWFAITDNRGVCPTGWHVPTDTEWETLKSSLGDPTLAGGKLKETGTLHWLTPNTGATNETGFTAVPGGYRLLNGSFASINLTSYHWSSTVDASNTAFGLGQGLHYNDAVMLRGGYDMHEGAYIRCLKNP